MKYRELLEQLKNLTDVQLDKDVVFCPEDRAWRISKLDIIEKPLYYDPEDPDKGCFELDLGEDSDDYELAYEFGYPLLTD